LGKNSLDIHGDAHRLKLALNLVRTKEGVKDQDRKQILKFIDQLAAEGIKELRLAKYAQTLALLSAKLQKPFEDCAKDDITTLVRSIEKSDKSEWTKHDYKVALKRFFQWLRNTEEGEYPPEVSWIRTGFKGRHKVLPSQLLTMQEITKLANAASNPRDKALVQVLYESGCRVGEILSLTIKQTSTDEYGCILIVKGKTGMRRVRIIASAPALTQWIENHPDKDNQDAPLWVGLWTRNLGQALDYNAVRIQMKKLAKKAGIKKHIYPHLFRHTRASNLAGVLTESQLKEHFGWTQGSDMASVYVHLSGRDVDKALLKANGIEIAGEEAEEEKFRVRVCLRCKEKNSPGSSFCRRCGSPLSLQTAIELQKLADSEEPENENVRRFLVEQGEALAKVLQDPQVQSIMIRKFAELGLATK
jgi:integrase/recombinase XerD